MEKRVDHLCLQLGRDAADHSKIEKGEAAVRHDEQITRMRIGMKEPVLEQLFQVSFYQQSVYFFGSDTDSVLLFQICDFCAVDEFHREHLGRCGIPKDLGHINVGPVFEI